MVLADAGNGLGGRVEVDQGRLGRGLAVGELRSQSLPSWLTRPPATVRHVRTLVLLILPVVLASCGRPEPQASHPVPAPTPLSAAGPWFAAPHRTREIGALFTTEDHMDSATRLSACFDAVIFIDRTTAARTLW